MTKALHTKVIYINHETKQPVLFMAMELSDKKWKLAFSDGVRNRERTVDAGNRGSVLEEIQQAIEKLGLPDDVGIYSCYEAGRDGFWIHRWLTSVDVTNFVIDSSSIEQNRKKRKAKTDRIDAHKMVSLLIRHICGGEFAFSVIVVPSEQAEDNMRLHRERDRLIKERGAHCCRMSSLLVTQNLRDMAPGKHFNEQLDKAVRWDNTALMADLVAELKRENARYEQIDGQIKLLEKQQKQRVTQAAEGPLMKVQSLMRLKGVGWQSAWLLVMEMFGWRKFKNRKKLAGFVGLTGTPYDSGDSTREQGISKAGSKRVRKILVELSWFWLRYQPQSELALWFERRFAHGGKRMRRIGIVAVARKLLISLWRFVEEGTIPQGAMLKSE
jgi:transposase